MNEPGADFFGRSGKRARRFGIDPARQLRLGLGLVDGRIGGGIDDDIRPDLTHSRRDVGQTGEVAAQLTRRVEVERDKFPQRRQTPLQFPAELAALAKKKDFHDARPP